MPNDVQVAMLARGAALWNEWRVDHDEMPDLSRAGLRGLDLSGFDLSQADLRGADLRGTNLSGANLSGADLEGARGGPSSGGWGPADTRQSHLQAGG
jgi:uncharacterized protein YjbI with pentapeptide repeats